MFTKQITQPFLLLIFLGGFVQSLTSQTNFSPKFVQIDKEDGLPGNVVFEITQDYMGFIWMATNNGLCRYVNDREITLYRKEDQIQGGLQSNNIRSLYADKKGTLWIGTRHGGLTCFHQPSSTWKTFMHDPNDPSSISNDEILSILEDAQGRVWVGTENGLNLFDPETNQFRRFMPEKGNPNALQAKAVLSIYEDHLSRIWVGTWNGGGIFGCSRG